MEEALKVYKALRECAVEMYESGMTYSEVAEKTGLSTGAVYKLVKKLGKGRTHEETSGLRIVRRLGSSPQFKSLLAQADRTGRIRLPED